MFLSAANIWAEPQQFCCVGLAECLGPTAPPLFAKMEESAGGVAELGVYPRLAEEVDEKQSCIVQGCARLKCKVP